MGKGRTNEGGGGQPGAGKGGKSDSFGFSSEEMSEKEARRVLAALASRTSGGGAAADHDDDRSRSGADYGSVMWERIAFGAIIILLPLLIWLQQYTRYLSGETLGDAPLSVKQSEVVREPGVGQLAVYSKMMVKMSQPERASRTNGLPQFQPTKVQEEQAKKEEKERKDSKKKSVAKKGDPPPPPSPTPPPSSRDDDDEQGLRVADLEEMAWTRAERLRVAIVAGEMEGPQAALSRISKLEAEAKAGGALLADLAWLRKIYEEGSDTVPAEARRSLIDRHGWFAKLALAFGQADTVPSRADVILGGKELSSTLNSVQVVHGLIALSGLVIGIGAVIKFTRSGYACSFNAPPTGGSVYLETFAVFLLAFAVMNLVGLLLFGLGVEGTMGSYVLQEALLWSLVLTIFYPLLRGVKRREWMLDMGFHKGEGVLKEIGAGIFGWLGTHLLLFVSAIVIGVVQIATGSEDAETKSGYGIFEAPEGNTWLLFVMGIVSAVVWAPVVEESIMRGALYRHLASRFRFAIAVLLTSAIFGIIHPYSGSGLFSVAVSGISFALLREWRGSLIAPMVAHALHNFSVSLTQIVVLSMLSD